MNTLIKIAIALFTTYVMTMSAFASSDDTDLTYIQTERDSFKTLAITFESLGININESANINSVYLNSDQITAYDVRRNELQARFNSFSTE